ncbi:MAG: oxidoreductase [Anaerolineales bacterium]|nr:oxidoreductase [Anaerolineales bacterium]
MKKAYMIIDLDLCIDCNNCFLACKDEFVDNQWLPTSLAQPRHGQRWMNIMRKERGQFPLISVAYLPTPCMHCENADCMVAAENDAIYRRDDGIVIIDPVKAKGQKAIVDSCPYGVIWWNEEEQIPQKCTFCAHLLDDGWEAPRCVQACATGALVFKSVEEKEMEKIVADENLKVLNTDYNPDPHVYYKNLQRYTHCFIGGSLAVKKNGITDCLAGATITLYKGGEEVGVEISDAYGDFKADHLKPNSGSYLLEIKHPDHESKTQEVDLNTSINLGTIWI